MARIYSSLTELIGHTPLLEVKRIEERSNLYARLLVKIEAFNPGGSAKDRIALAMIEDAEKSGLLLPGGTIVEPTSGNTGVGLAWVAMTKGYKVVLTMPDTMSVERQSLLRAMGARLVLTPGAQGMAGAIDRARKICEETPGAVILGQFVNPANPHAHEISTAREIWDDTDGKVDIVVAGVGTGGTITGIARGLKKLNPSVCAVAVEPADSPVLSGGKPGPHKIQGIGAGFVPDTYDSAIINNVYTSSTDDAIRAARLLAAEEGLLVGISSGAAFSVAMRLAAEKQNEGKTIVVILPDTGQRYLSTNLFASDEYPL